METLARQQQQYTEGTEENSQENISKDIATQIQGRRATFLYSKTDCLIVNRENASEIKWVYIIL